MLLLEGNNADDFIGGDSKKTTKMIELFENISKLIV